MFFLTCWNVSEELPVVPVPLDAVKRGLPGVGHAAVAGDGEVMTHLSPQTFSVTLEVSHTRSDCKVG